MPKTAKRASTPKAEPRQVRGDRRKAPALATQLTEDEADVIISKRREEDEEWIPWEKVEAELHKE